jgi:hypothetical protein
MAGPVSTAVLLPSMAGLAHMAGRLGPARLLVAEEQAAEELAAEPRITQDRGAATALRRRGFWAVSALGAARIGARRTWQAAHAGHPGQRERRLRPR